MYSVKLPKLVRHSFVRFHASLGQGIGQYYIKHSNIYWLLITELIDLTNLASILLASHTMAEPQQTLYEAITQNDIDSVRIQLANNVNPNVFPNNPTITPLILAVMLKFLGIANELLMNGADVNGVDEFGRTALHVAVDNNDEASISILISHNCNLEKYDNDGLTPLTLAVEKNNIYMVRYLVAQGAKVYKFLHENELSPLLYAAFIGRADILQVLLNVEETDRETKKMDMFFALCMTVEKGYLLAAKLLIDYGAPLDRLDEFLGIANELLMNGADVNGVDEFGRTALHVAVDNNDEASISILISHNCNLEKYDNLGATPLALAVEKNNIYMVRYLVAQGAVVYKEEVGIELPPLSFAACLGYADILQFLL
ncbi:unnamed protein product, partial [Rodentolepis nana]|uniref:ANK_REP_REGION domain-containing protein n=1 Tax=Rodentolepis nana TaxID=102285 RepID=A0A0R3TG98_RODNA